MKLKKKTMIAIVILAIVLAAMLPILIYHIRSTRSGTILKANHINFYDETQSSYKGVSTKDLAVYTSIFDEYNSYVYFSTLNDSEKLLYHAYEYAMDNSYTYLCIRNDILDEMEASFEDVLRFLSLDQPLLEANLDILSDRADQYTTIVVNSFNGEKTHKRSIALEVAKDIYANMDETVTGESAISEYFYDYLKENVKYKERSLTGNYLYDAICLGVTNCDGYSSAYTLLCKLAGITCCEKLNTEMTHVWSSVKLDGVWYNVDASSAQSDRMADDGSNRSLMTHYGFSDATATSKYEYKYNEKAPICSKDFYSVDCYFTPYNATECMNEFVEVLAAGGKKYLKIRIYDANIDLFLEHLETVLSEGNHKVYHEYNDTDSCIDAYYFLS